MPKIQSASICGATAARHKHNNGLLTCGYMPRSKMFYQFYTVIYLGTISSRYIQPDASSQVPKGTVHTTTFNPITFEHV